MDLGMGEILLVLLFALLIYGGRLPEVARSLGRSIATVKRSLQETTASVTREIDATIDLDADQRPRTVRRVPPPPPSRDLLATEDVSQAPATPVAGAAPPEASSPTTNPPTA